MQTQSFDIAVIGGGVVGLAILRSFAIAGLRAVLLERGADILSGASKGNSALLHTGFDAPLKSLELACMRAGYAEFMEIRRSLNLPLLDTGALVTAWDEEQKSRLEGIVKKAHANGVQEARLLSPLELRLKEPQLSRRALAAVYVPGEHVIDPWSTPLAYAHQALHHGASIWRNAEVSGGDRREGEWRLATRKGEVRARLVINAAGNFGDLVERIVRNPPFQIKPRKGQFVVFDKPAYKLVRSIILPVPSERTKGVVLFRTIFGNLAIGPTAEDQEERETACCDEATLAQLKTQALTLVPSLEGLGINAIYAGLRPASDQKDYVVEALPVEGWITVAGIRSTGLTAALGIAAHVRKLYGKHFGKLPRKLPQVEATPVPSLAEDWIRPYQKGGELVCFCERVTRQEVLDACEGPLPAGDLGGLKRRTRAMMGRCQGFYCSAEIAALTKGKFDGTA